MLSKCPRRPYMNAVLRRATDKYDEKYLQAGTWLNVREESQIGTYKISY